MFGLPMKLKHVIDCSSFSDDAIGEIDIVGLSADSRKVKPNDLFFALKGSKVDGDQFITDALSRGAAAVVSVRDHANKNLSVPIIGVDDPRRTLALAAAKFYQKQPEVMVAVTGTSGKTSVASFTRQIWADAGFAAANIGTTGVFSPKHNEYGTLTTPDPVELHALLRKLTDEGVTHAIIEASSHGLDQRRIDGVKLTIGAFTNLDRDHMDYHLTTEDYLAAKMRLFNTLLPKGAPAIIFADDQFSSTVMTAADMAGHDVLTVGRKGEFIMLKRVEYARFQQYIEVVIDHKIYEVTLPLAGDFQVANALVAAGIALMTGVPPGAIMRTLGRLKGTPGRLELIGTNKEGALAYIDYAHKPGALEKVLTSVRPFTTGRIILVFGCGGDRDKGKRPIMGEIATRLADIVIVTDDNPRSEVPEEIRAAILVGAPDAREIGDRHEAINEAVKMMKAGDVLVVAGKGHEEGQIIGDVTYPFSDRMEIVRALNG